MNKVFFRFLLLSLLVMVTVSCGPPNYEIFNIGRNKQLLVDDYIISSSINITRELGQVTKLNNSQPIFDGWFFGTVLYDEGKFKLWHKENPYGYAESSDGINFTRIAPLVGLNTAIGDTATFYIDPNETDPAHRYKASYSDASYRATLAYSADGINWTAYNGGLPVTYPAADTGNQIIWDSTASQYRLFTRTFFNLSTNPIRGTRSMTNPDVKADPKAWTLTREWKFDREGPNEFRRRQVYSLNDWIYEGVHFGLVMVYEWPGDLSEGPADYFKRHERDVLNYYIATSRDGDNWDLRWVYAGQPIVPRGTDGAWDKDFVIPASEIITQGDKHWLYYAASNERHNIFRPNRDIGVATLRLDGFVGMTAKIKQGTVTTQPFTLEGTSVQTNVIGETFFVEVLSKNGDPISGFTAADATTYQNTDALRLTPVWQGIPDLSSLKGQVIRLKFYLRNATIYSFQIIE